jgi:hypothetical protein
MGGPIFCELGALLGAHAELEERPRLFGFVGGLGGKDIVPGDFETMVAAVRQGKAETFQWLI